MSIGRKCAGEYYREYAEVIAALGDEGVKDVAAYVLARYKSELALPTLVKAPDNTKLSGRGRALCALAFFELGKDVEAHRLVAEILRTAKREGKWLYWFGGFW